MSEGKSELAIAKIASWIGGIYKGNPSSLIPMIATEKSREQAANKIMSIYGFSPEAERLFGELGNPEHSVKLSALRDAMKRLADSEHKEATENYRAGQERRLADRSKFTATGIVPRDGKR